MNYETRLGLVERLRGLRRRLRWLYLLHGLGLTLLCAAAAALLLYGLDRSLHLPATIRIAHSTLFAIVGALILYRKVFYPLRRKITERDLALAVERRFPELRDRLVSAIDLPPQGSQSPELLNELYRNAAEGISHLPLTQVFDGAKPARSLGLGGFALLVLGAVLLADPEAAGIWLRRSLGDNVPWPQQTFLEIQIAQSQGALRVERNGGAIRVEIARGADLSVRVVANGTVPDSVIMHLPGGRTRSMLRTGEREFNHLLTSVREPLEFWVTGGDDEDEDPRVEVIPDQPPELAKISVQIDFPAYAALPPVLREGGAVEALTGSRARVTIEPSRPVARGLLRFQGSGEEIPLQAGPASAHAASSLIAEFEVKNSDRYAVELYSEKQIKGADNGSYAVIAVPDRKPEIRLLSPARSDFDATPRARVPLRAALSDDFGIASASLLAKAGKEGEAQETPLLAAPGPGEAPRPSRRKEWVERPIEVAEFRVGDRPPHEGESILLRLRASDNRDPNPNSTESGEIRILLVSEEEIERRIQDNLSRAKESVEAAEVLQRERLERVQDLLAVLESESKLPETESASLRSASVGQSRVVSSSRAVETWIFDTFELALYNRFHRDADAWIERYEEGRRTTRAAAVIADKEDAFSPDALTRETRGGIVALRRAVAEGRLGAAESLGKISEMAELAATLAEDHSKLAVAALETAALAKDASSQKQELVRARDLQKQCLGSMEKLLAMLAEWDNYQTVINLSKELLDRQRSIQSRMREWNRQSK